MIRLQPSPRHDMPPSKVGPLPPQGLAVEALPDAFAPQWIGERQPEPQLPSPVSHPAYERILTRMPMEVRQSFTPRQLVMLSLASMPKNSPHVLDYRVSVPFFGRRFYLTLLAGREQRSRGRLAAEAQLPLVQLAQLNSVAVTLLLAILIVGAALAAYIVKSALGIDMFEGDSAMHDVFRALTDDQSLR